MADVIDRPSRKGTKKYNVSTQLDPSLWAVMEAICMNISDSSGDRITRFLMVLAVFLVFTATLAFGSEDGSGGGLTVIPDESLFIQIANFLILIWVLNLILFRPIRNVLIQRKEKIAGLEQSADTAAKDLQEKETAYAKGIKEARTKGLKEKELLIEQATEEEKRIVAKINEKAQADLSDVRQKIAKDEEAAKASLAKEIDGFANAIGEKILGRAIS
jgi:F-type H+-transporting ATPase subunit b